MWRWLRIESYRKKITTLVIFFHPVLEPLFSWPKGPNSDILCFIYMNLSGSRNINQPNLKILSSFTIEGENYLGNQKIWLFNFCFDIDKLSNGDIFFFRMIWYDNFFIFSLQIWYDMKSFKIRDFQEINAFLCKITSLSLALFLISPTTSLQTFAAYNSCIQGSLGKLQGQGVTHFEGFVWRRILMEECVSFSLYI